MARRRRWGAKFAEGLGKGLSDLAHVMLQRELITRRGEDARETDRHAAQLQALARLSVGDITPSQYAAMGFAHPPGLEAERVRPPLRRRLAPMAQAIDRATSLLDLPTLEAIMGEAAIQDAPNVAGVLDMLSRADGAFTMDEAIAEMPPEVRDVIGQAQARRHHLRNTPTLRVDTPDPASGAMMTGVYSLADMAQRLQTGLSAADQGRLEGEHARAKRQFGVTPEELGTDSGLQALAELAAFPPEVRGQASGRQRVAEIATAGAAQTAQASRDAYAARSAQIRADLDHAQAMLDIEHQKAMHTLASVPLTEQTKQWAQSVQEAREAAAAALPLITRLRAAWIRAEPEIRAFANRGLVGTLSAIPGVGDTSRLAVQALEHLPRGLVTPAIRQYLELVDTAKPALARAMRQVGNLTEAEQDRAGLTVAGMLDALDGTAMEKFDRIEALFAAGPTIAQELNDPRHPRLAGDDLVQAIDARIQQAMAQTRNRRDRARETDAPFDVLITPEGMRMPRRPR